MEEEEEIEEQVGRRNSNGKLDFLVGGDDKIIIEDQRDSVRILYIKCLHYFQVLIYNTLFRGLLME